MKKGFTLVELSIVLVIIGLLIGGILVGQSLIQSAQINALVKQVSQYDIATIQFKVKYKSLPGDSRLMPSPGDGDGRMEDSYILTNPYAAYFDSELSNFWFHLSLTGFQPERVIYSNNASSGIRAKTHIPKALFGKGTAGPASFLPYTNQDDNAYYFLADWEKTTNTQFNNSAPVISYAYTPVEAMAVDKKLDDGHPNFLGDGPVHSYHPNAGTECYSGEQYLINRPNKECWLFVKIATDTGDMKQP